MEPHPGALSGPLLLKVEAHPLGSPLQLLATTRCKWQLEDSADFLLLFTASTAICFRLCAFFSDIVLRGAAAFVGIEAMPLQQAARRTA